MNNTDCVLFIDESVARTLIAFNRIKKNHSHYDSVFLPEINTHYSPILLSEILDTSIGQANTTINRCVAIGVFDSDGSITEIAQKIINSLITNKIKELKN